VSKLGINWDILSAVWECFENEGLAPDILDASGFNFKAPILLCGAGAGLLCPFFSSMTDQFVAIDQSPMMVRKASARGFEIREADIKRTQLDSSSFKSVVVSTGIIDARNMDVCFFDEVVSECKRLLMKGGCLYLFYFCENSDLEYVMKELGLIGIPSNHGLMTKANSLQELKCLFERMTHISRDKLAYLFDRFSDLVENQFTLIQNIKQSLINQNIEPVDFIEKYMGYPLNDLSISDRSLLQKKLSKQFYDVKKIEFEKGVGCFICYKT
jgi:SAM-dependent methyltransferase